MFWIFFFLQNAGSQLCFRYFFLMGWIKYGINKVTRSCVLILAVLVSTCPCLLVFTLLPLDLNTWHLQKWFFFFGLDLPGVKNQLFVWAFLHYSPDVTLCRWQDVKIQELTHFNLLFSLLLGHLLTQVCFVLYLVLGCWCTFDEYRLTLSWQES